MDHTLLALHLPSLVILDMFWIPVMEGESQPTVYLQDFGVIILPHADLVPIFR